MTKPASEAQMVMRMQRGNRVIITQELRKISWLRWPVKLERRDLKDREGFKTRELVCYELAKPIQTFPDI